VCPSVRLSRPYRMSLPPCPSIMTTLLFSHFSIPSLPFFGFVFERALETLTPCSFKNIIIHAFFSCFLPSLFVFLFFSFIYSLSSPISIFIFIFWIPTFISSFFPSIFLFFSFSYFLYIPGPNFFPFFTPLSFTLIFLLNSIYFS
jgi:hypothetical protein